MKNNSKVTKIVAFVLSILVLVLGLGLILKFTGLGEKIVYIINPTFAVEYDGKVYKSGENNLVIIEKDTALFKVSGTENYSCKVTPNVAKKEDLIFNIDGTDCYFAEEKDISSYLIPKENIHAKSFEVNCLILDALIGEIYDSEEIVIKGNVEYPYLLTVTSADGEKIVFKIVVKFPVGSVVFDKTSVVF